MIRVTAARRSFGSLLGAWEPPSSGGRGPTALASARSRRMTPILRRSTPTQSTTAGETARILCCSSSGALSWRAGAASLAALS